MADIYIYLDICFLSILSFAWVVLFFLRKLNTKNAVSFSLLVFCNMMVVLSNLLGLIYKGQMGEMANVILKISNFSEFLFTAANFAAFSNYCLKVLKINQQYIFVYLVIPCVILLIINVFTGWVYYIDENNVYYRGLFFNYYSVYFAFLFIALLVIIIINRKNLTKGELLSFICYIVIPSICILIQAFYYGLYLSQFASASLLLIVIIFSLKKDAALYIQREKEIQEISDRIVISQVQPHFLYNCISAIMAIDGTPKKTKDALAKFAKYLRFNLNSLSSNEPILFTKEMEHVENYVDLENLRMDGKIKMIYSLDYTSFSIPPLSIQMLVENAIKHGFGKKGNHGTVKISSRFENNQIVITVEDDGCGFATDFHKLDGHYGLKNLQNRITMMNGSLDIKSKVNEGTKVTVFLPKKGINL